MQNLLKSQKKQFSLYFVGIGGISMSALARYLNQKGFKVSGWDANYSKLCEELEKEGIVINSEKELEKCDLAVVSSAISQEDAQIKKLKELGKVIISRGRLLSQIANAFPITVGVAGTHGKTTCTAMIAHVFKCANLNFTAHIGGIDNELGNMAVCGDQIFLSEVCEYKKNISLFEPTFALLLNCDNDHLESYGSFENLKSEFKEYLSRAKVAVVDYEYKDLADENCVTFSLENKNANYFISSVLKGENKIECAVNSNIGPLFNLNLNSSFIHDVKNALACVAVCKSMGIGDQSIKRGIESFSGVKRRNQIIAKIKNSEIYADYAHHPKQIENTLKMLNEKYSNYALLFQSHTYSRTENLFKDFINALELAKNLFIFDTYGAREKYNYKGSGKRLSENLRGCVYAKEPEKVGEILELIVGKFECIAIIGAGNLYDYAIDFVDGYSDKK